MNIVSWNLNGLMSSIKNGSLDVLEEKVPDVICLQEIRTKQEPVIIGGYHHYWNHGERDGYSGTAMLLFEEPLRVFNDFQNGYEDSEGRLITAELANIYVVNAYVPNSQKNLWRQAYRMEWDEAFREHVRMLTEEKPVIICGDFNVARSEIDIYAENMRQYWAEQGYSSDERSAFESLLEEGLTDVFRELYPEKRSYTWWSNRLNKRKDNRGWRLDYFLVSDSLMGKVKSMVHHDDIPGSDHCPIELEVDL